MYSSFVLYSFHSCLDILAQVNPTQNSFTFSTIVTFVLGGGGLFSLGIALGRLNVASKAHLFALSKQVIEILDAEDVRNARHCVYYEIDRDSYKKEEWLTLQRSRNNLNKDQEDYLRKRDCAEKVARSFDKIGFLIREGYIPINVIARFYCYPVLKCWYQLHPYIRSVRSDGKMGRNQRGHMWHFEYLCVDIIIPKLKKNKGCWKGVMLSDDLGNLMRLIGDDQRDINVDFNAKKKRIWEIKQWWNFLNI